MEKTYTLTILMPDKEAALQKSIVKMVKDFITKKKGTVVSHESWGSKDLAYPVGRLSRGSYEHFVLTVDSSAQPELARALRDHEEIVRYLFVKQ